LAYNTNFFSWKSFEKEIYLTRSVKIQKTEFGFTDIGKICIE
jgi:hypothetical protein